MKDNNICAVYSLIDLINTLVKDDFIHLDIVDSTFDDTYTIKLSWMNGIYSTQKVFSGNEILKDNGKLIANLIKEETGYDIYGNIEDIASCKKQEKAKSGIGVNDFISAWNLDFNSGNVIKYITRASLKNNNLEDLKKARWYINKLIDKAIEAESQRQKKYYEEDVIAINDMFDYINNAFGAEIFHTKKERRKNRRP